MIFNPYHDFFNNMANPLKIDIVLSLNKSEKNVSQLTKNLKEEQSKISHALSALKSCKIVEVKQRGKERIYSLNKNTVIPILKILNHHSSRNCTECSLCK